MKIPTAEINGFLKRLPTILEQSKTRGGYYIDGIIAESKQIAASVPEPPPTTDERATKLVLFNAVCSRENYKHPTTPKQCATRAEAEELADAIAFFVGGAEIDHNNIVRSHGYYFYIGA